MLRSELITRVRVKIDEYTPTGVTLPFDDYIGPLLDESARDLLEKGPLYLMNPSSISLTGTVWENDKAYIPVPSDYVRLYEIKYALWKKSVREAISRENPLYKIQENEYIKGGYGRPSVAITVRSASKFFECSKVLNTVAPSTATYVKSDVAENLNDQLADALTWLSASKLLGVFGYGDKAQLALGRFNDSFSALIV